MKKIFTLFVALFAFAFCVKAQQVTVILEAHDVWSDGSGYQLLLDADHNTYGTIIPETGPLTTSGDATAATYAEFEYKIPTNADGSLSTSNIVYDGSDTITIPAGTYDWCVTNPTPGDRMWIAGEGRADDYVFDPAYIYHFTVALNGSGGDAVTITLIPAGDDPTIMVTPTSVEMSAIVGNATETTVEVAAYNLTAGVTATTVAPFSVSSNGSSYSTTATIDQNGGTLYIKYSPTTAGTDNGMVTLSSAGAPNATVLIVGTGIDCGNTPLPYSTDFSDEDLNQCWTIDDYNGDDNTWEFNASGYAVYPYNSAEAADDWLISPVFHIGANAAASFDYMCASASYPERFEVYVIGAGQTYETATLVVPAVDVTVTSWTTQDIDLTAFANQYIQVAIRCTSDADEYLLGVTNFFIDSDPVSIANVEKSSVNVYPNPASNYINVNASSNISNVEVYTISGQKVGDFTANGTQTVISTANLSNGMYLMRINTENGVINNKFSVVR